MKKQLLIIGSAIMLGAAATSLKAQTASLQVIHNSAEAAATLRLKRNRQKMV